MLTEGGSFKVCSFVRDSLFGWLQDISSQAFRRKVSAFEILNLLNSVGTQPTIPKDIKI